MGSRHLRGWQIVTRASFPGLLRTGACWSSRPLGFHAVRLATLRYESGFSAYFEVLDAQEQLLAAETSVAQLRRDRLVAMVDLYRALGGGWPAAEASR